MSSHSHLAEQNALVIATYGKFCLIDDGTHAVQCTKRSSVEAITIGDRVCYQENVITQVLPRRTLLHNKGKNIAANIDVMFITVAVVPHPDLLSIDSYLIKAHSNNITPVIVLNKIDLPNAADIKELLSPYRALGYAVVEVSIYNTQSIQILASDIGNNTCVFVGHSGVGKSSLINTLIGRTQRTNTLGADGLGTHTTTSSALFAICGGSVIDTPGVREFVPTDMSFEEIKSGFIEFKEYLGACKFANCKHINEPDCEIKKQVDNGVINARRYQHYVQLASEVI